MTSRFGGGYRLRRSALPWTLTVTYLLLLTAAILFKLPFVSSYAHTVRTINLIPFPGVFGTDARLVRKQIVQNIGLFVPLGLYVTMLTRWTLSRRILAIAGLSLTYEILQFIFAIGVTDITDLIDNVFGGIVGIGIYSLLSKLFRARTPHIVGTAAAVLTVVAVVVFAVLFWFSHFVARQPPLI
jgi:glycopeptide antibiotics resistance protein